MTARLELLGGFRLQTNTEEPVPLPTKKAWALLAYLALHPSQGQSRAKLAALLWGDRSEAQARDSLRQALSLVQKALARAQVPKLVVQSGAITFRPSDLKIDALAFEHLVALPGQEHLEEAVGLYHGEFLEGLHVQAPEFESWATAERARFREKALETMAKLLDHYLVAGAVDRGIQIAARLLAADPLQERVHRVLMELYSRQGRHAAALRQYRTCVELLAKELSIEPDATTKALRRDILRDWNRQKGETASGVHLGTPAGYLDEIENEPPVPPRSLERRQVTVLVCDLAGMSAIAARVDPEELQALIAVYQHCCTPIISRFGGEVGKLSGAEMLVYFGYPQAHEHDVECAVHAGLNLVEAVQKLDVGRAGPLQLRVGIATGPVVVGDFVANGADQHSIVGEAAQLAGSLERVAASNTVMVAASTRQLVGNLFDCDDLGQMALDGFSEPFPAWRVLGPSRVDNRFEALRASTTPLIGRDEELDLLLRRWRQAASGDGRVVLLSGEPGIGKSRLAMELQERLQAEPHTRVGRFCSPHHQDSALYPIISQLQRAAEFWGGDTDQQRLDKLEALLARATNDPRDAAPLIADLLSIPTSSRYPPLDLTPQKRKEKTLRALLAQLEGLAAHQTVLVVFEDIHWIDPTSLELLDLMVNQVPMMPVLLIITFRPEFAPPWVGSPQVTLLTLSRLSPPQSAEVIAGVTGGKALPQEIVHQVIDHTDGVPLFIEELTKSVVESGLVTDAGDQFTVTGLVPWLKIPTTLHGSLLSRLDRLAGTREVAQIGAALGRQFSHELVSAVAGMPQQQLDDALAHLVRADLIFRRGTPPDAEYTFKHALVQDAAYGTLLRSRRQQLHARIAATMEDRFPEIAETQPEILARHCTEAGLVQKAVGYWLSAGRQAIARWAIVEAEARLRKGLDVLSGMPDGTARQEQELTLQITLGNTLIATAFFAHGHGTSEAGAAFVRARQLCEQLDRPTQLGAVLYGQWVFDVARGKFEESECPAEKLRSLGEVRNDLMLKYFGSGVSGSACFGVGKFIDARAYLEKTLSLWDSRFRAFADSLPGPDPQVRALISLSLTLSCLGYVDQARLRRDEALTEARRLSPYTLANALAFTSRSFWAIEGLRAVPTMLRSANELLAISRQYGFPLVSTYGDLIRGWCLGVLGQSEEGIPLLLQGITTLGTAGYLPFYILTLAEVYGIAARPEEGLNRLAEAANVVETTTERWAEAEIHRLRGTLLMSMHEHATAEDSYHQALRVARRQRAKFWELRAATSLARLWRDQGKRTEAHDLLAPIYGWFTEGFDTPVLQEAKALLDQL
jgi:class 3 adenylate cyclase/DNA-binding SARP family transcriptional activator